jgi:hypothetical protein
MQLERIAIYRLPVDGGATSPACPRPWAAEGALRLSACQCPNLDKCWCLLLDMCRPLLKVVCFDREGQRLQAKAAGSGD